MILHWFFAEFVEEDADHGQHARDKGGREDHQDPLALIQGREADNPSGDAGADDGAENNADRFVKLHQAGVNKADGHDAGRRRRLNQRRHSDSQQNPLKRVARQLVQNLLQSVAGNLAEAVAHQRNTV